ncbi:hypothetical protein BJ742DRAFT_743767 [Cladochytrium replicatum]|nr:hypothetical protein BJ742DRAFT_743767 [Cladochytrium replicatum]
MRSKHSSVPAVTAAYKPFITEYRLAFKDPTSTLQKGRTWKRLRKMGVGKIEPTQTNTQQQHQQPPLQKQDAVRFRAVEDANDSPQHAAKLPLVSEPLRIDYAYPHPPSLQRPIAAQPAKKQQDQSKQTEIVDRLPDIYTNVHGINAKNPEDMPLPLIAGAGFHHYDLVGPLHVWQRQEIPDGSYEPTSLMLPGMVHPQPPKVNHAPRRRVLGVTSPMLTVRPIIVKQENRFLARTPGYNIITGYDPLAHLSPEELAKLDLNFIK